jgi:hypothetical protein
MKQEIFILAVGALAMTVASAASPRASVNIGINPCAFGVYSPPAIYQPYQRSCVIAPPAVYFGGGAWGGDRVQPYQKPPDIHVPHVDVGHPDVPQPHIDVGRRGINVGR